jgi:hypothetical protein
LQKKKLRNQNCSFFKNGEIKIVQTWLFKDSILRNYSLEKSNNRIYNVLNVQTLIKTYHLNFLKSALRALVSISHKIINVYIYKMTVIFFLKGTIN